LLYFGRFDTEAEGTAAYLDAVAREDAGADVSAEVSWRPTQRSQPSCRAPTRGGNMRGDWAPVCVTSVMTKPPAPCYSYEFYYDKRTGTSP